MSAIIAAAIACVLATTVAASAQTVTLSWDPPPSADRLTYLVEWGPAPGDHRAAAAVGAGARTFETPPLVPGLRYYFIVRSVDADGRRSGPSNEISVVAPADGTLTVGGAATTWDTASVEVAVQGQGTVASSPSGIDCGTRCRYDGPAGMPVVLTASPEAGFRFTGWTSGCEGVVTCSVRLGDTPLVSARFEPDPEDAASSSTRYLAEGAVSAFFSTRIALANPGARPATVTLTFQRDDAAAMAPQVLEVAPLASRSVEAAQIQQLQGTSFATTVHTDAPVVVDRTMTWQTPGGLAYGAHAETSVAAPAPRWYLAEGATHGGFDLFYLLHNPNPFAVRADVRFLRPGTAALEKHYDLAPASRRSIWVDLETFGPREQRLLGSTDVSAVVATADGSGIVVERAMYHSLQRPFSAGLASAGVTAPATAWYFAEGATGAFFDLFLLIANPDSRDARLRVTYLLPDGRREVREHRVPAAQRYTIWVDQEGGVLADTALSVQVESIDDVPVVVERSMWWPGDAGTWRDAHHSPGATATGVAWAVADGDVSFDGKSRATYLLVANPAAVDADVQVTLLFQGAPPAVSRRFHIGAGSRLGIDIADAFPEALGQRFGALVEVIGPAPPGIIVERAMYADGPDGPWSIGTNLLATRLR